MVSDRYEPIMNIYTESQMLWFPCSNCLKEEVVLFYLDHPNPRRRALCIDCDTVYGANQTQFFTNDDSRYITSQLRRM